VQKYFFSVLAANGGDGLEKWRVSVDVLSEQSHGERKRGGTPAWMLSEGITAQLKNQLVKKF
jgi:hypothetical protein